MNTTIDIAPRLTRFLSVESESRAKISIGSVENSDVRSSGRIVRTLLVSDLFISMQLMFVTTRRLGVSYACYCKRLIRAVIV